MSSIDIKITNASQIKAAFLQAPVMMTKNLSTAVKQTVFFIGGKAKANANIKTGRLRASEKITWSGIKGEIEFTAKYAGYIHDGTMPHVIRPKGKQALWWKGLSHPVKVVHHPGYKGNPYLKNAVEESQHQTDKFFTEAVDKTLDQIARETH